MQHVLANKLQAKVVVLPVAAMCLLGLGAFVNPVFFVPVAAFELLCALVVLALRTR